MRIYLDIDSRRLFSAPGRPLSKLEFKRRDNDEIELIFLRDDTVQELAAGTIAKIGVKVNAEYESDFLALATLAKTGTGTSTVYTGELNFNTNEMSTAFAAEPVTLAAMLEIEWITGAAFSSSKTLPVTLHNDVIRGDEGSPATLPLFYTAATTDFQATQAQAETGVDNAAWMSPLRTAQAIAALGGSGGVSSWNDLTDVPAEFAPEAHTHSLADLTDSGATTGQVVTYDGTAWVPQDASAGVTSYYDLPDVPSTFPPSTHTHAASEITSGTLAISRIPTGTTFTTVALGNHTHSTYAASSHTHAIADVTGLQSELDAIDTKVTATGGFTTISVVSTLPLSPDPTTIYIITT